MSTEVQVELFSAGGLFSGLFKWSIAIRNAPFPFRENGPHCLLAELRSLRRRGSPSDSCCLAPRGPEGTSFKPGGSIEGVGVRQGSPVCRQGIEQSGCCARNTLTPHRLLGEHLHPSNHTI